MLKNRVAKTPNQERISFTMTIFNNLKRSATDAANKAAKKTGEITNIAKLTMNIKNAEGKLDAVYQEIGRLFYNAERSGEDATSEIASNIMKADKIKADIASYKAEIAVLRNVIICEACGNEISAESAFCSFCGAKVEKPAPAEEAPVEEAPAEEECCCCEDECDCEGDCDCTSEEAPAEEEPCDCEEDKAE